MLRRDFLRAASLAGTAAFFGPRLASGTAMSPLLAGLPSAGLRASSAAAGMDALRAGGPLYVPPVVAPRDLTLTARAITAELAPGVRAPILSLGDGPIAPTIRATAGERATITLRNALDEPTILHWHGLRPPEEADGHPRLAIAPGASYAYDWQLDDRPGTYWYHPHPHMRTAAQIHLGMVGLFILADPQEAALGLPGGERELALVLQDKRPDANGQIAYGAMGHDMMEGVLGSTAYVNGVRTPSVEVESARYRVRVLGAANARIFRLALSNERPLQLLGTDGGLLDAPVELPWMDLATGERADLVLDFSGLAVGTRVRLVSLPFESPYRGMGGMGMGGGGMGGGMRGGMMGQGAGGAPPVVPQGGAMELLEFVVTRAVRDDSVLPSRFAPLAPVAEPAAVSRTREFRFRSAMMQHSINGRMFEMDRVDEVVPFGSTERWEFVNDGPFPHPVHMHAVQFRVVARQGGRGRVMPWETGWKDTVLVYPGERVSVVATFDRHRGLFLMHCHNLEHEDHGMMMNFRVE